MRRVPSMTALTLHLPPCPQVRCSFASFEHHAVVSEVHFEHTGISMNAESFASCYV